MSNRTNKIFNVTVATYANMAVEAESPQEAMEIAEKYKDEYLTEEDFEDSDIEVDSCETYSRTIDDYETGDKIFCKDGVIDVFEYYEKLKWQKENEK